MGEAGGALCLAAEALDELLVLGVALVEELDRDPPPELLVLGQVDARHAPRAELAHDAVAAVEDGADQRVEEAKRAFARFRAWSAGGELP